MKPVLRELLPGQQNARKANPGTFKPCAFGSGWGFGLLVHFEGEPGTKYGGLIQEFFTIISRQLCSSEAQVFKHFEDSNCIWFSYEVSTQDDIYFLIGNLFGIALYNRKIIALPFPLALFKKLANIEPTLEDLKELCPTLGRNLQNILYECRDDIFKTMMLDFTIVEKCKGSISEVNLKENGANIPVTSYNRKEYVDAYVNYIFNESVKKQFGDFVRGFQRGCPSTTWKMFLPVELHSILFGNTAYQWDQLEKNVKYKGFEESDETIKNFWTVFYDFPEESKKDFLAFLTGTVHIPGETMDNFSVTIVDANQGNPDQSLPMVHTCHRILFLQGEDRVRAFLENPWRAFPASRPLRYVGQQRPLPPPLAASAGLMISSPSPSPKLGRSPASPLRQHLARRGGGAEENFLLRGDAPCRSLRSQADLGAAAAGEPQLEPENFKIHALLKAEKMLCWGYWSFGFPGSDSTLQAVIPEPRTTEFVHERSVKEVACGKNHSVFLLEDGEVYTCGVNTKGQLGHEREGGKPEQIDALADQHIVHVACGESHNVALSDQGQLFSWGAGSDGQLGLTTTEDAVTIPRLIKKLNQEMILQVSCGNWHCLALAADGQFFAWGQNNYGQLGLGKEFPSQNTPQRVRSLDGIPLCQVAAGGAHSFALSLSGAVFGWGKNTSGQLGLSDEKDRECPCHVKLLRTQKVVYISCGNEHTAVLTKSGGVFTFGAGSCGQLGHDSLNDEVNPRRVLELMGSEVSQVACGRQHTLAFVPSSGMIYAFGCGTKGQLGNGHICSLKCPSPVKGHWAAYDEQISGRAEACTYYIVKHIFSGEDQSFVICSEKENSLPADDFRTVNQSDHTCLINDNTIDMWRQKLCERNNSNSVNEVVQILSSAACWNGSFLEKKIDEHFKTSPKIPGIDLNCTRVMFNKLMTSQHSTLRDQILKSFESFLIPQLPSSPPDVEAMRIYLILPEFPLFQDSKYYVTLTLPLATAILRLDKNPSKVLENWWSQVCPEYFLRLVDVYKDAVVYLLNGKKTLQIPVLYSSYITAALKLLEKLHKVNQKANHIEYDKFYIPEISNLIDIQEDYLMWFLNQAKVKARPSIMQDSVTLCSYPFIFDAQAKTKMLQTDAKLQMQTG
ncbi:putative E3 ubiquitin-protein ligase HERC3 [Crotalus adamanteus]|uniref:E3 ubiquitin-protein ligase HERC3 n=1 Tax=Crotalus adamanteus TaxID=8729 RepID=A0AAW1B9S7_CROAD